MKIKLTPDEIHSLLQQYRDEIKDYLRIIQKIKQRTLICEKEHYEAPTDDTIDRHEELLEFLSVTLKGL